MPIVADKVQTSATIRTDPGAIFISLELSRSTWLITSLSPGSGEKMSKHLVRGGDVVALLQRFSRLREMAERRTRRRVPIVLIQEAGLDGFRIHRTLEGEGIESHVVDAASMATSRRRRRVKTDRIDGEALVRALLAFKRTTRLREGPGPYARGRGSSPRLARAQDINGREGRTCESDQGTAIFARDRGRTVAPQSADPAGRVADW